MKTLPKATPLERSNQGGFAARRAVARWAWRLFRREWRQLALVVALLTLAVAAAVYSAAVAYNLSPVYGNAESGSVDHWIAFDVSDPESMALDLAYAEEQFGIIDVIGLWTIPIPGSTEFFEFRAQDPDGPYSAPMLALLEGRYPTRAGEVAVTDGVALDFGLEIGARFIFGDRDLLIVGLVENPSNLNKEFALLAPLGEELPEQVNLLVDSSDDPVLRFRAPSGATTSRSGRPANEDVLATGAVYASATILLLLLSLVAAASFVVLAQRRLRQLGMLAAIGATQAHLRLVMVANGFVIGVIAALTGALLGLLAWLVSVPVLEPAVGARIDPLNVPWWLVATGILLAIATATGAAWWPARTVARIPVIQALSGRPPKPKPARRSAGLALLAILVGILCLALSAQTNGLLIVAGAGFSTLGLLLASPLALRLLARVSAAFPVGVRLALRDLSRYQDRSGAALAAISLALGIAAVTVIAVSAAEFSAEKGNLAANQLMVRTGTAVQSVGDNIGGPFAPERSTEEVAQLDEQAAEIAALLDNAIVIPINAVLDPRMEVDTTFGGRPTVTLGEYGILGGSLEGWRDVSLLFVATPELLSYYAVDLDAIDPAVEILTIDRGDVAIIGVFDDPPPGPDLVIGSFILETSYTSLPASFTTAEAASQRGWEQARAGWLLENSQSITPEQIAAARGLAAEANLTVEARDYQEGLLALRPQATASGMALALGVLAMTVGLIRSAAVGDLRTLTANGASESVRRTLTAATAGALALLGASLGTVVAYLALAAWFINDLRALSAVPMGYLLIILAGVPTIASLAGWLLAGGEPEMLSRQPIE
jgi:putative ABC transport system permease protein